MTIPNLGRGGQPVYAPTGATATVTNNSRNVSFSGTAFIGTDPTTGAITYPVGVGDILVVSGIGFGVIESVNSVSALTLTNPWAYATQSSITSQGSPGWYIIRNQIPAYGATAKALQDILAIGSDTSAETTRTWDNGVSRIKVRFTGGGKPEFAVGGSGALDGSLVSALQIDPASGIVSFPSGQLSARGGMRNRALNGNFDFWQRGTTFSATATNGYVADRWITGASAGAFTASKVAPSLNFRGTNALNVSVNALPVGANVNVGQRFEGRQMADLAGQDITVSFDVNATITAGALDAYAYLYANTAQDNGTFSNNISAIRIGQVQSGTNILQATFPASSTANVKLGCSVVLYLIPTGSAGNVSATFGSIQVEEGKIASPFEFRPFSQELALVSRYYQKSYRSDVDPGTAPALGTPYGRTVDAATFYPSVQCLFPTQMRINPTVRLFSPASGTQGYMYDYSGSTDNPAIVTGMLGRNGFAAMGNVNAIPAGHLIGVHWTADAEL